MTEKKKGSLGKETGRGLVIVYTGDGKGKTSAAMGLLMRAWGREMKAVVIQFIKNGSFQSGEILAAKRMGIEVIQAGDGWTWKTCDMQKTIACGEQGWEIAKQKITNPDYDVIILDEFTYPLQYGWLNTTEVVTWLKQNKSDKLHLVITGRNAPAELVEFADLVSEMTEIKTSLSGPKDCPSQKGGGFLGWMEGLGCGFEDLRPDFNTIMNAGFTASIPCTCGGTVSGYAGR